MKIATYNINSIRSRASLFFDWLKKTAPDIVFLQEIKCETEKFLYFECESLGYHTVALGQKSYNGVAVLSKYPFVITENNLPSFQDDDAMRYLEILVDGKNQKFYAASLYAPNGCSLDKEIEKNKLAYKLKWFDLLYLHIKSLKNKGLPIVLGGDFNVMMTKTDVYDAKRFEGSPLYIKSVQDKIIALQYLGMHDAFRLLHPTEEGFTFWDYFGNAFVTNSGLRIDYLFLSAQFAEKLKACGTDTALRSGDKPSDHTALIAEFEDKDD